MQIQTSAGTYSLNQNESTVTVYCSDTTALDLLIDGLELVSGKQYTPDSATSVTAKKEHIAQYFAFEIEEYLEFE
jgi:hypothetical protein